MHDNKPNFIARIYTFFSLSRYGIQCFISDNYTHLVGKYCQGSDIAIGSHKTLQAAKAACSKDNECDCIWDQDCDDDGWKISKGHNVSSSSLGSCAWLKSKFIHARKKYIRTTYIK